MIILVLMDVRVLFSRNIIMLHKIGSVTSFGVDVQTLASLIFSVP